MSIVYIVALESELPKQHDMDIRYCGVGKVNAAPNNESHSRWCNKNC